MRWGGGEGDRVTGYAKCTRAGAEASHLLRRVPGFAPPDRCLVLAACLSAGQDPSQGKEAADGRPRACSGYVTQTGASEGGACVYGGTRTQDGLLVKAVGARWVGWGRAARDRAGVCFSFCASPLHRYVYVSKRQAGSSGCGRQSGPCLAGRCQSACAPPRAASPPGRPPQAASGCA